MFHIKITGVSFHDFIFYKVLESACNLITKFWHDPSKYANDLSNDILEEDMIAEDIPELLIDEEQNIEKEKIGQVYNHNEDTSSNIEHSTQ